METATERIVGCDRPRHAPRPAFAMFPAGVLRFRRYAMLHVWLLLAHLPFPVGAATAPAERAFNLAAGDAAETLKSFAAQAQREIMFPAESVAGVLTHAVQGRFPPRDAIERMIAQTELTFFEDITTGAFVVNRTAAARTPDPSSPSVSAPPSAAGTPSPPMQRKSLFSTVGLWLALALSPGQPAAHAAPLTGTAALSGTISNAATGHTLEGARVAIASAAREAVTDHQGVYRFADLPSGNVILSVSYTGLDTMEVPVTVRSGAPNRQDVALTAGIYRLEKFVVAGEREGNARAVTMQRQAPNVKNVVSADAFGSLSGNPSELLERLPGVVVERVGGDPRYVSLRGTPGTLNSIQIDGNRRATAGERSLNFESVGSDFIESMELVKSPTPDMDADAIGGTVNLRSRSGFDLAARRVTYALGIITGAKRYPAPIPVGSFSYSDVVGVFGGTRNLGISFSSSFRQHIAEMDFTTMNYERTDNSPAYMNSLAYDGRSNLRTRWGGGLKLDYKLSPENSVFVSVTFSPHMENSVVPVTTVATAQTVATLNAQGQPTGTGAILPGYTDQRTEARVLAASTVSLSNLHRQRDALAYSLQLGGRLQKPAYTLDYDASYSYSKNNEYFHTVTAILRGVGWVFDRTNRSRWTPVITYTGGPDPANLNNYSDNLLTFSHLPTTGEIAGTQVNYLRKFALPVPSFIKAGVRLRREEQQLNNFSRRWRYAGADGVLNSGDENLGQFQDLHLNYRPMHGVYPAGPILSPDAMRTHKDNNLTRWQEDVAFGSQNPLTGRQMLEERVTAAYLMGNTKLGRFSALAGVRVEQTDIEAEGALNFITPAEKARRAAFTGALTDAEIIRRNQAQYGTRRLVSRDYRNVFPGVHLKFDATNRLLFRGSYSTSIGRPVIGSLIPNDNIDADNRIVQATNPGLRPQNANNFDATAEYYFEPAGVLSFGVFLKEISNFIYSTSGQLIPAGAENGFEGEYAGYELRSQTNGGFARIRGWEANYQQRLVFLPGWWSGFGLLANYTWLDTKGDYGTPGTVQTKDTLAGFTPAAGNFGISYIRDKYNFRVVYGYNAETLIAFNAQRNLRRHRAESHRVDLKLKYILSRRLDVYLDVYNLTNDKQREVWGAQDRPRTILDRNDPQIHAGINGRF